MICDGANMWWIPILFKVYLLEVQYCEIFGLCGLLCLLNVFPSICLPLASWRKSWRAKLLSIFGLLRFLIYLDGLITASSGRWCKCSKADDWYCWMQRSIECTRNKNMHWVKSQLGLASGTAHNGISFPWGPTYCCHEEEVTGLQQLSQIDEFLHAI